jgi:conjugal transfer pilus assembly protein TraV
MKHVLTLVAITVTLSGCGNLSGLDASEKFACSAPDGVTCMSVSGIYANAKANNLPGMHKREDLADGKEQDSKSREGKPTVLTEARTVARNYNDPENTVSLASVTPKTSPKSMSAPNSGAPVRTPERILRVWLAPFEDQEGDLHDQKYFYVTVNSGAWTIEANRVNIRSQFQQVYPLSRNNAANKSSGYEGTRSPQQQAADLIPTNQNQVQDGSDTVQTYQPQMPPTSAVAQ